jgi:DNA-dependent protein kinase catalytic subunit
VIEEKVTQIARRYP